MNPRTTGILFFVALLLGGFIYFYEIRGGERREQAAADAKRLFVELAAADVVWLEVRTDDGKDARLERVEGSWQMVEPLEFPADPLAADGIADALAGLTSEGVIEDPHGPEVYGLSESGRSIRFGVKGGETLEVRVGDPTPLGSSTYLSVAGRDEIYTVESFSIRPFERSLDGLREGRPLRFDRDAVDRIAVRWAR